MRIRIISFFKSYARPFIAVIGLLSGFSASAATKTEECKAYIKAGFNSYGEGDFEKTLETVRQDPTCLSTSIGRNTAVQTATLAGMASFRAGKPDQAIGFFNQGKGLAMRAETAQTFDLLTGAMHQSLGQENQAQEAFKKAGKHPLLGLFINTVPTPPKTLKPSQQSVVALIERHDPSAFTDMIPLFPNEDSPRISRAAVYLGLIDVESKFKPNAKSPKGAQGLGQMLPTTAEDLEGPGVGNCTKDDLYNKRCSFLFLKKYMDQLRLGKEALAFALTGYNMGPNGVEKKGQALKTASTMAELVLQAQSLRSSEPRWYALKVMKSGLYFQSYLDSKDDTRQIAYGWRPADRSGSKPPQGTLAAAKIALSKFDF